MGCGRYSHLFFSPRCRNVNAEDRRARVERVENAMVSPIVCINCLNEGGPNFV